MPQPLLPTQYRQPLPPKKFPQIQPTRLIPERRLRARRQQERLQKHLRLSSWNAQPMRQQVWQFHVIPHIRCMSLCPILTVVQSRWHLSDPPRLTPSARRIPHAASTPRGTRSKNARAPEHGIGWTPSPGRLQSSSSSDCRPCWDPRAALRRQTEEHHRKLCHHRPEQESANGGHHPYVACLTY